MTLASKAMIVTLGVSCWTARRQDKSVTAEVEQKHGAHDAGRFNKLLIDKAALDPLTSFAGKIRNEHYRLTLPWMDNGGRLLPTKLYFSYLKVMDDLKSQYRYLVEQFINQYPQLVSDARKRLGTMYDPTEYPGVESIRRRFAVDVEVTQVPQAQDFRVEVGDGERARIQAEIEQRALARQKKAMDDAWARVREVVSTIELRCSADKTVLRESLMENAQDLVALLPGLNIADDPALTAVTQDITDNLLVDMWTLRNRPSTRKRIAAEASRILTLIPSPNSELV